MVLIAFVGKPSAGKSTLFKAATLADAEIANYPFTTIKPNHAIGFVSFPCVDQEFQTQCHPRIGYCADHYRFVPVDLLDVAGLVKGANEGKGMGNQFLDDLNKADVLVHVVDISGSTNEKGESVPALSHDPLEDILFLEEELNLWFLRVIKKGWDKFLRTMQQEKGEMHLAVAKQLSGIGVNEEIAKEILTSFPKDLSAWTEKQLFQFATKLREKTKPLIIAANKIDIAGSEKNVQRLKEKYPTYMIIPCSADAELALREAQKHHLIAYTPGLSKFKIAGNLNEKQEKALQYIQDTVLTSFKTTGVQEVLNAAVFKILNYIAVYPGGVNKLADSQGRVLPDCFLLKNGSTSLDFAYKLHTDFGEKFIRAIQVKKKITVGKEYMLQHRDVLEIVAGR